MLQSILILTYHFMLILLYVQTFFSRQYLSWHGDSNNDLMKVKLVTHEIILINVIQ